MIWEVRQPVNSDVELRHQVHVHGVLGGRGGSCRLAGIDGHEGFAAAAS